MKYLITGGAGFIGSHLVERLLRDKHEVVALDDLSAGHLDNLEHLEDVKGFDYVIDSVTHEALLQNLVSNVDVVFHLADAVGTRLVVESPVEALEVVLYGTQLVLNAAAQAGKKVVLGSSSEVYGRGGTAPAKEDDPLNFGPTDSKRWSYGIAKAAAEHLALAYAREEKLPVVIARIFNTAGPRQGGLYGTVLPRFAEQALKGGPITVYGDGSQRRSFCWVGDVVEALAKLAECEAAEGEIVNVGSAEGVSILELAEMVRKELGPKAKIEKAPLEKVYGAGFEEIADRVADLTKLERLIGLKPGTRLAEIIVKVGEDARRKKARIAKTVPEN